MQFTIGWSRGCFVSLRLSSSFLSSITLPGWSSSSFKYTLFQSYSRFSLIKLSTEYDIVASFLSTTIRNDKNESFNVLLIAKVKSVLLHSFNRGWRNYPNFCLKTYVVAVHIIIYWSVVNTIRCCNAQQRIFNEL